MDSERLQLFAFSLNYIVGAGVLVVPYCFVTAGFVASTVTLLVCGGICLITSLWLFDIQRTVNELERHKYHGHLHEKHVLELGELCNVTLGPFTKYVYDVFLIVFVLSTLWFYTTIVALSLQRINLLAPFSKEDYSCDLSIINGPLWNLGPNDFDCYKNYLLYIFCFGLVVMLLLTVGLKYLKSLELGLTLFGIMAMIIMILWTLAEAVTTNAVEENNFSSKEIFFNPKRYGSVFDTFVFALLVHSGVPTLCNLSLSKDKRDVAISIVQATVVVTLLYLCIGITCALVFGQQTEKIVTLNWSRYEGFSKKESIAHEFIRYFILVYPCITCAASFPLYIISLGNNFAQHITKSSEVAAVNSAIADVNLLGQPLLEIPRTPLLNVTAVSEEDELLDPYLSYYYIFSAILPLILSCFLADVRIIFIFIGFASFAIAFFIPAALQLRSLHIRENDLRYCELNDISPLNGRVFVYICLGFGIVACGLSTSAVILEM